MKKLLALAVIATALVAGNVAKAAAVDIFVSQQGIGSQLWDITVVTDSTQHVGAIALLGNTSVVALATNSLNAGVSAADSGIGFDVLADGTTNAIGINNTATGVTIAFGSTPTLLGRLTITAPSSPANLNPGNITYGDSLYNYTATDQNGVPIDSANVLLHVIAQVPEPATMLLLGIGLAGLALVRRTA